MSIEAMKQALDFLEWFAGDDHSIRPKHKAPEIAVALRQAIAEAEMQEPVAFRNTETGEFCTGGFLRDKWAKWQALYTAPVYASDMSQERGDETAKDQLVPDGMIPISNGGIATRTPTDFFAPPKREWVGLSGKEVKKIVDKNTSDIWCNGKGVARDVEAKLKEKNT
jgi:hypothetical protein